MSWRTGRLPDAGRHAAAYLHFHVAHGRRPDQTQWAALAKLVEVGTCSQNHLGRLIYLDAATIKGVVDRLRIRKLVTVQDNPKDRRRSMIALTRAGRRVAEEAVAVAHLITAETLVPLKQAEQRQVVRLLQKLI